jgi:hypothetical protein
MDQKIASINGVKMGRTVPLLPLCSFVLWTEALCILLFLRHTYTDVTKSFENRQDIKLRGSFQRRNPEL